MATEKELKTTFIEEYSSAKILKDMGNLKSAVILISKALFALCDYVIFEKYSKLPKNHSERFRILELKEKAIFVVVDSVWSKYTDTYSKPSNEESYNLIKNALREIIKNEKSAKEFRDIIEE